MIDHFFTISIPERDASIAEPFKLEGISGKVFTSPEEGAAVLFRALNKTSDNLYAINMAEYTNALINDGYTSQTAAGFIFSDQTADIAPLFRLFCVENGDYFYTTNDVERENVKATLGFIDEGIAGFVKNTKTN
jgi:hypothetical protein